ncbi:glucan endo-1,3-beta-D-glucosidase [Salvia divinorum]|uniref:glucan endo-1,3-beta-D-glucosidase n=1 Tax=Salvia divinorum TaxID=28513 RepID=A0ABD1G0T8_SALDI
MEILVLFLLVSTLSTAAAEDAFVGVNIGANISSMLHPTEVAALLESHQINHVRLYDADAGMLLALANTSIAVSVSIPNDEILGISQSNSTAAKWLTQNVLTHYPHTNITTICVGADALTPLLPNALKHMHSALSSANLEKQIKISAPLPYTIIINSFPPSQAYFNKSLNPILIPLLKFLQSTNSHFMISIYPYLEHVRSNDSVSLDYALFKPLPPNKQAVDANTSLRYENAFDAMVDAVYSAMANLNFSNVPITVAESGWPSQGGSAEATSDNARTYNMNLVQHLMNKSGTPGSPGVAVSAYIYELYNQAAQPLNWGLFEANGEAVYTMDFGSSNGSRNQTYCAAKAGANEELVQAALDWACGAGGVDCSALMEGQPCFEPDTLSAHATYAFDSYYQAMGRAEGSCDFNGVAAITSTTPSHGSCIIPQSASDKNGSRLNSTAPAMDSESSYSSASLAYGYGCGDAFSANRFVVGLIGCVALLF